MADANIDSDDELEALVTAPAVQAPLLLGAQPAIGEPVGEWFIERSKFIPVRLTISERKYLRLLEAALQVRLDSESSLSVPH
jgi:hypothetical protein